MRRRWAVAAATFVLAAGAPMLAWSQASDAGARFRSIYTTEWAWRQAQAIEPDWDTADSVSPHMPEVGPAAQAGRLAYWQAVLAKLDAIPVADLSAQDRENFQIYRAEIEVLVNDQLFRDYEKPLNSDSSFWSNMSDVARRSFKTAAAYRNYIAMLNDMPRYFREQTVNMRAGLKRGFTPPRVTLVGRDQTLAGIAEAKEPQEVIYYAPFKEMPASIPPAEQAALRADGLKAMRESVIPAHAELLKFMREEYMPGARQSLGAETWPDGKAYYHAKIKEFTTLDLPPDRIHQIGLDAMAGIHAEMLQTIGQAGFKGDLPAFLHFLRTDPQFYAKTPQELLMRSAYVAKLFDGKSSQYFGRLPRQRFAIVEVPRDIAPFWTSARGGPGVYFVNTYDLPSRGLYSMPALTLHESAPGHAFQMPLALEHKDQPEFRQKVYISAYGEGWALYCERLGQEMGMYRTPYETFGMLSYQAWRAARLVVDTGIHHMGWTRDQALQYLRDNTALSEHEIETETDRYISYPGQALAFYLGEQTIWDARHKAERALGPKFNIRAFHDTVLELGSVPLPVLTARIDRFIAEGGRGPYPEEE